MENEQPELQSLQEKKDRLVKAVSLMLDWQKSERIKKSLLPHLESFNSQELDYLLEKVRNLDNETQFRGPLADSASKFKSASDNILVDLLVNIDPNRLKELEQLLGDER